MAKITVNSNETVEYTTYNNIAGGEPFQYVNRLYIAMNGDACLDLERQNIVELDELGIDPEESIIRRVIEVTIDYKVA